MGYDRFPMGMGPFGTVPVCLYPTGPTPTHLKCQTGQIGVKARTSRLFSLIFGCLDSKPKVLDCAIKTTKMCSLSVFEGEERFVSTQT